MAAANGNGRIRALVVDHHFAQDLQELVRVGHEFEFRKISPIYFAKKARRFLPEQVFAGSLTEFTKDVYSKNRALWARAARIALRRVYILFPFDVLVSPSDTFFYLRDVVAACRELGIPFVVVQKETTISPATMEYHSRELKTHFPFIGDLMTVCSERHKEFWVRAGTDPSLIRVTGQPRFDFYSDKKRWGSLREGGMTLGYGRTILFLSYELNAYASQLSDAEPWRDLREHTEDILVQAARDNSVNLIVKPHPQQDVNDVNLMSERLRKLAPDHWGRTITVVPRDTDTRQLIVSADLVVGFQTTALMEALMAGKPVLYTHWGAATKLERELIPFHTELDTAHVAFSPEDLRSKTQRYLSEGGPLCSNSERSFVIEYLGPFDGRNAERTLREVSGLVRRRVSGISDRAEAKRLLKWRSWFTIAGMARGGLEAITLGAVAGALKPALHGSALGRRVVRRLQTEAGSRARHSRECLDIMLHGRPRVFEIAGPPW